MEHGKVLKRAWDILRRYKALWVFGVLVAIGVADVGGRSSSTWYRVGSEDFSPGGPFHIPEIPPGVVENVFAIGVGLACVAGLLIIATMIARFVGEVALIRMVDHYEDTGETWSVRQGFRIGWSRSAWRLFLINIAVDLPAWLALLLVLAVVFAPLLLWLTESSAAGALGTVLTIGLFFLLILVAIVIGAALALLKQFFRRVCVLENQGVVESIRQGYAFVRRNLKDVGLMWLIMTGVGLAWSLVLVPVTLLLVVLAAVVGGGLGLAVYSLAEAAGSATPWVGAILVGLPMFLLAMGGPLAFLGGLMETFKSSAWTLTYRELRALERLEPEPPQLGELDLGEPSPGGEPSAA